MLRASVPRREGEELVEGQDQGFNVLASRKPGSLPRLSEMVLNRLAERRSRGKLIQPPPRNTRIVLHCPEVHAEPSVGAPLIALAPAVLGPLPDVPMDVVKVPRVGLEAVDRKSVLAKLAL